MQWNHSINYFEFDECFYGGIKYICVVPNISRVPNFNIFNKETYSGFWEEA